MSVEAWWYLKTPGFCCRDSPSPPPLSVCFNLACNSKGAGLHSNREETLAGPTLGAKINGIACPLQGSHMGAAGENDNESPFPTPALSHRLHWLTRLDFHKFETLPPPPRLHGQPESRHDWILHILGC